MVRFEQLKEDDLIAIEGGGKEFSISHEVGKAVGKWIAEYADSRANIDVSNYTNRGIGGPW